MAAERFRRGLEKFFLKKNNRRDLYLNLMQVSTSKIVPGSLWEHEKKSVNSSSGNYRVFHPADVWARNFGTGGRKKISF